MGRVAARINGNAAAIDNQCQRHQQPLRPLANQQQQQPLFQQSFLQSIRETPNLESKANNNNNNTLLTLTNLNSLTPTTATTISASNSSSKSFQKSQRLPFHLPILSAQRSNCCASNLPVSCAESLKGTCCAQSNCTFTCSVEDPIATALDSQSSSSSSSSDMYQQQQQQQRASAIAVNVNNLSSPLTLCELLPECGSNSLGDYSIVERQQQQQQQLTGSRLIALNASRITTPPVEVVSSHASQGISGCGLASGAVNNDECLPSSSCSCCCSLADDCHQRQACYTSCKPGKSEFVASSSDLNGQQATALGQQHHVSCSSRSQNERNSISNNNINSSRAAQLLPLSASSSQSSSPLPLPLPETKHRFPSDDCHSGSTARAARLSPQSEQRQLLSCGKRANKQQQQQQQPYATNKQQHQQQLQKHRNHQEQRTKRQSAPTTDQIPLTSPSLSTQSSSSSTSTRDLTDKYRNESSTQTTTTAAAAAAGDGNKLKTNKSSAKAYELKQQQQHQNKQHQQQQHKSKATTDWNNVDWKYIARRYREMPRQHRGQFWWEMRKSCLCHVLLASINSLFPILTSFKNYSLPGHLLTDLMAGFTIAVLHIPQGMAYGMLSGVEPIYGLYVSFVPVLIMALMSKSRHVSYGTFAVISMILASSIESVRLTLKQQVEFAPTTMKLPATAEQLVMTTTSSTPLPLVNLDYNQPGVVLTNNHQALDPVQNSLRTLLTSNELSSSASSSSSELQSTSGDLPVIGLQEAMLQNYTTTTTDNSLWSTYSAAQQQQLEFVFPTNIEILTCICLVCGLIQMAMSLSRLGILSLMFSDQLVSGFTTASAINVVTSQLSGLFDLSSPIVPEGLFKICRTWWAFGARLYEGGFNQYAAIISLSSILFLLCVKELMEPALRRRFKSVTCLPSELVLMSVLITASWYWQFEQNLGINVVGHVPTGLPTPQVPRLDLAPLVLKDSITVALVSFAMNLSLAQVYAKKFKYSMDPNQELFALGTSNLVSSFFSCFPCASSLSRSAIQSSMNVRSQLCSLFSCAIVVSIICYFAPILHDLPRCALSCIIIVALKGILVQIRDLGENWRLSKLDALVWIMTFMSVIAFGITYGLIVGVVASLFMMLFRLLTPNHSILGHLQGTEIFVDTEAFPDCKEINQVKIFRFNSALCYLNRTMFKACVEKSLPSIYKQQSFSLFCSDRKRDGDNDKVKFLIIDCSALAYCDYSGAATLVDIIEELEEHKVNVYLAACPLKLINMIERMQKLVVLEQNVYPTIADAIHCAKYLKRGSFQVT